MSLEKLILVVSCLIWLGGSAAWAGEIKSVSLIGLAESHNPWTVTVEADGGVEWKKSSSGYLVDSFLGEADNTPKKSARIGKAQVAAIFKMIDEAGYTKKSAYGQEPKIKLIVKFTDGTQIINSGPNGLLSKDPIKPFREIERAMVEAAGFDYQAEVKKYEDSSSEPYIFLFYSVVYGDNKLD